MVGCTGTDENQQDATTLMTLSDSLISIASSMDDTYLDYYIGMDELELSIVMYDSGIASDGESFADMLDAWKTATEEIGSLVSMTSSWTYEESGSEAILTASATFDEKDAVVTFIYKNERLESLTIDPETTMGEVLTKAGLNTILGMGTVFSVLIFIAFCISLFKYIPIIEEKLKNIGKKQEAEVVDSGEIIEESKAAVSTEIVSEVNMEDEFALVAVITAAIAASEEMSTDGFVVRSIKRKKSNKWNG